MLSPQPEFRSTFSKAELNEHIIYRKIDYKDSRQKPLPEIKPKSPTRKLTFNGAQLPPKQESQRAYSPMRSLNSNQIKQLVLTNRSTQSQDDSQRVLQSPQKNNEKKVFCNYEANKQTFDQVSVDFADRYNALYTNIKPHDYEKERFYGPKKTFAPTMFNQPNGGLDNTAMIQQSKVPVSLLAQENAEKTSYNIPYQAPDRKLVMALLCEYDIAKEQGIPYSGSVRVQRKTDEKLIEIKREEIKRRRDNGINLVENPMDIRSPSRRSESPTRSSRLGPRNIDTTASYVMGPYDRVMRGK